MKLILYIDQSCAELVKMGYASQLLSIIELDNDVVKSEVSTSLDLGNTNLRVNACFAFANLCKGPLSIKQIIMKDLDTRILAALAKNLADDQADTLQFYAVEIATNLSHMHGMNILYSVTHFKNLPQL